MSRVVLVWRCVCVSGGQEVLILFADVFGASLASCFVEFGVHITGDGGYSYALSDDGWDACFLVLLGRDGVAKLRQSGAAGGGQAEAAELGGLMCLAYFFPGIRYSQLEEFLRRGFGGVPGLFCTPVVLGH